MNARSFGLCVLAILSAASAQAQTEVYFTQKVDKRFAWLGNDAKGEVDFNAKVLDLVNGATTSIDACYFSFGGDAASGVPAIGRAMAAKAAAGLPVRLIINGAQRSGPGLVEALKGPVQVIDDNFSALLTSSTGAVARINFQRPGGVSPAGWLTDEGAVFGAKPGGFSYGWTTDVSADMLATTDATYTSSLLGHCYAKRNSDGPRTWEIEVPNGYYYVYLMVGQPGFSSKAFVTVEGENVFRFGGSTFFQRADCGPGEFKAALVSGGEFDTTTHSPQSKRIHVTDGRLSVEVGKSGETAWSSLCHLEIYRGSGDPGKEFGDSFTDKTIVQKLGIQHAKYLIVDGSRLWTGSANLSKGATSGADGRSEDAIETTHAPLIAPFVQQFDTLWGGSGLVPNAAASQFTRFKTTPSSYSVSVPSPIPPGTNQWDVWFSPSIGGLDISSQLESLINGGGDLMMLMEQFTTGGSEFGLNASGRLMNPVIRNRITAGRRFWGVFGNSDAGDPIFGAYSGLGAPGQVFVHQRTDTPAEYGMHDKFLLLDAFGDTRFARRGRVVMGAMNWSKAGMLYNDEQTLLIRDSAVANKYLQRAMQEFRDSGFVPDDRADIILVLDRSYSMNALCPDGVTTRIDASKMAAKLFVDLIEAGAGHRVGLVRFGATVEPFSPVADLRPLDASWAASLKNAIDSTTTSLPIGSATCYGAALDACASQLGAASPLSPRRFIHLFTDGMENRAPFAASVYPGLVSTFNAEIHSTVFDSGPPFGTPGSPTAILDQMAGASGGTFAQVSDLSAVSLQKRFIEVARDAIRYDTLLDPRVELAGRRPAKVSIEVDSTASSAKFIAFWGRSGGPEPEMRVVTPWGAMLTPASPGVRISRNPGSLVWHLDLRGIAAAAHAPVQGTYVAELSPGKDASGAKKLTVDFAAIADTELDLRAEIAPTGHGAKGVLLARVLREGEPLIGGRVQALWTAPDGVVRRVTLRDDGNSNDAEPRDGLFGAMVDVSEPGNHRFHVLADVKTKDLRIGTRVQHREAEVYTTTPLRKPFEGQVPGEPTSLK